MRREDLPTAAVAVIKALAKGRVEAAYASPNRDGSITVEWDMAGAYLWARIEPDGCIVVDVDDGRAEREVSEAELLALVEGFAEAVRAAR